MLVQQEIKDIKFAIKNVYGEEMEVSEPIVMCSAAGWYVGALCKDPDFADMITPFDRYTGYYATPEEAQKLL